MSNREKYFDEHVSFRSFQLWIAAEEIEKAATIWCAKRLVKCLLVAIEEQVVFLYSFCMKGPGVPHLGQPAAIQTDPAIKIITIQQKNDDQLGTAQVSFLKNFTLVTSQAKKTTGMRQTTGTQQLMVYAGKNRYKNIESWGSGDVERSSGELGVWSLSQESVIQN